MFKRFRDCPMCNSRLMWLDMKLYDTDDCWGLTCHKCGHHIGGWVEELPLIAHLIHPVKLLIDKMLYRYVIGDLGDGVPTVIKHNRFAKNNWRVALRYYTRGQKRELRELMEAKSG